MGRITGRPPLSFLVVAPFLGQRRRRKREGKTLDADETIEFTFSGDKISRLDVTSADQAAEDAFWG